MRRLAIVLFLVCVATTAVAKDVYLSIGGSAGKFRTDARIFNPSYEKAIVITARYLPIGNSDNTMHNVHGMPDTNREFNFGQVVAGLKNTVTFTTPEVMIPFKCDVHSWMNAYVGVVNHPYFAVTGNGGTFELKTVPPGTYTIEAWHEKLGRQTQSVTVAEKDAKDVNFTFKVGATQ